MTITRARIRNFKMSSKGRFRPTTEMNPKEEAVDKIMSSLYKPHLAFFHKRLLKLIEANMHIKGKTDEPRTCGLVYAGRKWFVPWMGGLTENDFMCLSVDPGLDETELIKVTANLGEIDVEMYEVKRFLAGLLSFSAPMDVMEQRLGRTLYNRIKSQLSELKGLGRWNEGQHKAFKTYADQHDYLIDAMCQRIMMTMLSTTAFNQR